MKLIPVFVALKRQSVPDRALSLQNKVCRRNDHVIGNTCGQQNKLQLISVPRLFFLLVQIPLFYQQTLHNA